MDICSEAFYKHWILFPTVWHLPRLSQGRTQGKQNVVKNKRSLTSRDCWKSITRHRGCEALTSIESLSIHTKFTAIVLGAYPGRPKCAKNVLKWRTFGLPGWITGKRLKIDGYMLRCVWQALNPLSFRVTYTAIVPWGVPMGGQNAS